ncbi:MAG: hypothetical protein ABSH35_18690 [Isosphaeraceae bacterium]|jgi:hypothetical protein
MRTIRLRDKARSLSILAAVLTLSLSLSPDRPAPTAEVEKVVDTAADPVSVRADSPEAAGADSRATPAAAEGIPAFPVGAAGFRGIPAGAAWVKR